MSSNSDADLAELRAAGYRIVHSPRTGNAWLVLGYRDVVEILQDHDTYSSLYALGGPVDQINPPEVVAEIPEFLKANVTGVVDSDPPHHTRFRDNLHRAYAGHRINKWKPDIQRLAQELAARLEENVGEIDLATRYVMPFVQHAMGLVMGIPSEDVDAVAAWGLDMASLIAPTVPVDDKIAAARRLQKYEEWADTFIESKRVGTRDDVISVYIRGDADAAPMLEHDVMNCLLTHFVAGTMTTRNAILTTTHQLLRDRSLWEHAVNLPQEYAARALEEGMRLVAPHRGLMRVTTREVVLDSTTFPAGTMLIPLLGSANLDENQFTAADKFDPDRSNSREHLAFGTGIHACIGMHLARQEGRIAIGTLLSDLPSLRLTRPTEQPDYIPDIFFRGISSLYVAA
ncbi:cytochrome P450 [Nocardia sp. NPDC052112]|uniref:cytochrome P450 n=1 Tax=Nocardia sp. NPDC052112 TaxID=3155646 RepID=UPI00342A0EF2